MAPGATGAGIRGGSAAHLRSVGAMFVVRTCQRLVAVLLMLFGCVGCDQASKAIARMSLSTGQSYVFLDGAS
jgi:hypothetical protein